jgi:hypothetical protein
MFMDRDGRQWHGPFAFDHGNIWTHAPRRSGVYQLCTGDGANSQVVFVAAATIAPIQTRLLQHAISTASTRTGKTATTFPPITFSFLECDDVSAQRITAEMLRWQRPALDQRANLLRAGIAI